MELDFSDIYKKYGVSESEPVQIEVIKGNDPPPSGDFDDAVSPAPVGDISKGIIKSIVGDYVEGSEAEEKVKEIYEWLLGIEGDNPEKLIGLGKRVLQLVEFSPTDRNKLDSLYSIIKSRKALDKVLNRYHNETRDTTPNRSGETPTNPTSGSVGGDA